ncbi:MAG: M15 family metallopeptidase [Treponema sp.]|jgi:D-alanyl-D-alanine carboxypeptidase|nr:M15 family metallopeptidase [Treponema sp.]
MYSSIFSKKISVLLVISSVSTLLLSGACSKSGSINTLNPQPALPVGAQRPEVAAAALINDMSNPKIPDTTIADTSEPEPLNTGAVEEAAFTETLDRILKRAGIPEDMSRRVLIKAAAGPSFILDLLAVMEGDPYLRLLVDKQHPLPDRYAPDDLVELGGRASYQVNRSGLLLRRAAEEALEEMATAAKAEGITLTASSAYRSYDYQIEVYARNVRQMGQAAADRESARPGYSQHQTGLVVDFGSIDDSFAETRAGRWMTANAGRFGWSLSFPYGYEAVTGYRWESWHYRYVGRELSFFIGAYFDDIQQYALQFIREWERSNGQ